MFRMFRNMFCPSILGFALLSVLAGCNSRDGTQVSLERTTVLQPLSSARHRNHLRIGMGAMITPKEGFIYYNRLKVYLEQALGMPIQLVDRDNYSEMNKLLKSGQVDAAFVSTGPYVDGHDTFNLQLLAVPQVSDKRRNQSYLIVPADSSAGKLEDLRGKTFAFTDPMSHSGWIVPVHTLLLQQETPKSFFGRTTYTYAHDKSIKAVAAHLVDGAAVDSLIYDYMARNSVAVTSKTKIITRSAPFGPPPFVTRADLDPGVQEKLRAALLSMHEDPRGKEILAGMLIDRFVTGQDREYDSVRSMKRAISAAGGRGL